MSHPPARPLVVPAGGSPAWDPGAAGAVRHRDRGEPGRSRHQWFTPFGWWTAPSSMKNRVAHPRSAWRSRLDRGPRRRDGNARRVPRSGSCARTFARRGRHEDLSHRCQSGDVDGRFRAPLLSAGPCGVSVRTALPPGACGSIGSTADRNLASLPKPETDAAEEIVCSGGTGIGIGGGDWSLCCAVW